MTLSSSYRFLLWGFNTTSTSIVTSIQVLTEPHTVKRLVISKKNVDQEKWSCLDCMHGAKLRPQFSKCSGTPTPERSYLINNFYYSFETLSNWWNTGTRIPQRQVIPVFLRKQFRTWGLGVTDESDWEHNATSVECTWRCTAWGLHVVFENRRITSLVTVSNVHG